MQKLVLTFTESDDCTYSFEQTVCFSYESKEKAAVDFQRTLLKKILSVEISQKKNHDIQLEVDKYRSLLKRTKKEDHEKVHRKILDLYKQQDQYDSNFTFANKTFDLSFFYKKGFDGEDDYVEEGRIQTLDEWFAAQAA